MLAELITWWAQQMRDVLPAQWRAGPRYADAVVVRGGVEGLVGALRRRGRETRAGLLEAGSDGLRRVRTRAPGPVVLALPAGAMLQQQVELPLAAERDLAAVLRYEMDRLTPFRADEVYWSWRVDGRERAANRLRLRLLLTPKAGLARTLAVLDGLALRPRVLECEQGAAGAEFLPLTEPGAARRGGIGVRLAAAVCVVLAVAALTGPVLQQQWAIDAAEGEVEALRPRIALVDRLRQQLAARTGGADLFATATARLGNPLRALAAVTAALPDDTYLTSFAMRERKLTMAGRSAAAVKLIGLLSGDPDIRDPAFDAPVTRAERFDLFSIRAALAP